MMKFYRQQERFCIDSKVTSQREVFVISGKPSQIRFDNVSNLFKKFSRTPTHSPEKSHKIRFRGLETTHYSSFKSSDSAIHTTYTF